MDPVLDPGSPAVKPGYKTTEFWLSLAAILVGVLLSSGVIADDSQAAKMLGLASSLLGSLGYVANRAHVKAVSIKGAALVEAAKQGNPSQPR